MTKNNSEVEMTAAEIRKAYFKAWRLKNPDKVKKHNSTYWQRKAAQKIAEIQNEAKIQEGEE